MSGSVIISRSIFDHEFFAEEPMTEREAWMWMIMDAAWKPHRKRAGDFVVDLGRGQLAASVRFMAGVWKWTPARVQRFIKRLQALDMISLKTDTGVSVITVCNYNKYQYQAKAGDTGPIQDRYRTDTNKKKGEIREEEETEANASAKKIGSRLPADWRLPKALGDWAVSQGMSEAEARQEADKFRDYWIGIPGKGGVKLDWSATWRNWVRKAIADRSRIKPFQKSDADMFGAFGRIREVH